MRSFCKVLSIPAVLASCAFVTPVHAAPTYSEFAGNTDITVPVSNSDLLQTNLQSVALTAGTADNEGTQNPAVLVDGQFTTVNPQMFTPNQGAEVTFTLNTSVNTAGYDISSLSTYGGWNDSGRDDQHVTVSYSTVSAPGVFTVIDTANFTPANADGGDSASRALFTTSLTNVGALRLTFGPQENGHEGYGEFDVVGAASAIPEPGSLAVLGLAAAGAMARRRRNV